MSSWIRLHLFAVRGAFTHLRHAPGNFLFNVLVVAIALALPIAGLTVLDNVEPVARQLSIDPEISIFMLPDASKASVEAMPTSIKRALKDVELNGRVRYVGKGEALAALQKNSGLAEVLSTLGENPLPDAYILSLDAGDTAQLDKLVEKIRHLQEVDVVQLDSAWIKRLAALLHILELALIFLASTLAIVVIVVAFNATRLQVMSHQAEIAVARLLGATHGFISKPYYYTGSLLGLLAGAAALAMVAAALAPLNQAIAEFAHLYASEFRLHPLPLLPSLALLTLAMLLGWIGAWLSVRRQLARAE